MYDASFTVHVDAQVTCDGYLSKLSNNHFITNFQRRWFQVSRHTSRVFATMHAVRAVVWRPH